MKNRFLLLLAVLLAGCQYELSPWQTDAHCPGVSVEENLAKLAAFEQSIGKVDYYQVAIIGDPQQYPGSFESTIKHVNNLDDVHFILLVGDLAETGVKAEFEWMCKAMSKSNKPIISVIGNHDSLSFGKDIWLDVFGPYDFAFTYQNSRFVAYNDNKYEFDDVPDRDWLAAQAAPIVDQPWDHVIGVSHIPPWEADIGFDAHLKENDFELTVHGHESSFDHWQWQDDLLPHYITTQNRDPGFGMLSVYPGLPLELSDCTRECVPSVPRTVVKSAAALPSQGP
ncbi:MAG: metallophosphoesterase [Bermanella sp.]